LKLNRRNT